VRGEGDRFSDTVNLVPLLLLLSFTTGLVDAVTVLGLGKVFTANMTGNVVFLGFAIARVPGFQVEPYLLAIASFLIGAAAGGRFGLAHASRRRASWLLRAASIEAVLLWIAAGIAVGFDIESQDPKAALYAIIFTTGVAMGFRNATIRQLKVPDLTTTVVTMTLTGLAADSALAGGPNSNWKTRGLAVGAILAGAVVGALLVSRFGLAIPLVIVGALGLTGTMACSYLSTGTIRA
jgi:uncharacterized membrane protein YoaK (UPF0700 family)